jgi:hypothetical protein
MSNGTRSWQALTRHAMKHLAACPNLNVSGFVRAVSRRWEISNA